MSKHKPFPVKFQQAKLVNYEYLYQNFKFKIFYTIDNIFIGIQIRISYWYSSILKFTYKYMIMCTY